ncbi:hypothetical protein RHGRI_011811 [Rhododendron griersonianum]|uniref:Uncharacterized protein n=1 Tax=Rhododendron griersonianum TaxID=479676 RepID=A0AAV6KPK5_9ERIC|nr:hypothetical protein RHGRI_011811 [Rhododendron griersonianum]
MDLNASPQPEDDDEAFESHFDESAAPEHTEHVESAVEILRRVIILQGDELLAETYCRRESRDYGEDNLLVRVKLAITVQLEKMAAVMSPAASPQFIAPALEREERRQRLKRERPDDRPTHASQPPIHDQLYQKNHRTYDKSKLPPGWLDCPASGQEINCIIPSKVPLCESFNAYVPPGKRYSSKQVVHQQRVLGRRLGLVIDLTNTSRYYQASDWKKEGIKHVKIQCRGRDSVPENEAVNCFVYEVSFLLDVSLICT